MDATRIKDPTQPVFALDHQVQSKSEANLRKYELIEAFAKEHGVAFFPAGHGIGHQVMVSAHVNLAVGRWLTIPDRGAVRLAWYTMRWLG